MTAVIPGWTSILARRLNAALIKPTPRPPTIDDLRSLMDDIATECIVAKMAGDQIPLKPLNAFDSSLLDVTLDLVRDDSQWINSAVFDLSAWAVERKMAVAA